MHERVRRCAFARRCSARRNNTGMVGNRFVVEPVGQCATEAQEESVCGFPESGAEGEEQTTEDKINRLMEGKKLLPNASYFAFTATPKNKTLEIFGDPEPQLDGTVRHRPFHSYTMKPVS